METDRGNGAEMPCKRHCAVFLLMAGTPRFALERLSFAKEDLCLSEKKIDNDCWSEPTDYR